MKTLRIRTSYIKFGLTVNKVLIYSMNSFSMEKPSEPSMRSSKITERINAKAFELLEKHPEGLRWSELLSKIEASDPSFHPKTVNGCIWKLVNKYPDKVYKPSKGLFRLLKYK